MAKRENDDEEEIGRWGEERDKEYTHKCIVCVCCKCMCGLLRRRGEYDSTEGLGSQETEKNADEPKVRAPQGGRGELMTVRTMRRVGRRRWGELNRGE